MKTVIRKADKEESFQEAAEILQQGGLVAFPTETVYGLGGNALDKEAAKKIYAAKGRPSDNPLIVHIAKKEALADLTEYVPERAWTLAEHFWPGPLTMILPKSEKVPYGTTGGLDTVAVRMPNHPVALRLFQESGIYIAAPSANISGRPSATMAEHVIEDFDGRIDMILDGGMVKVGIESTVVDLTEEVPVILRPGCITKEMLEEVLGDIVVDQAILPENQDKPLIPKAPGMKYRHYAPKADLTIVTGDFKKVKETINRLIAQNQEKGLKTGVITTTESQKDYPGGVVRCIGTRGEEETIARGLYKVLREFDHLQVDCIYAESFEEGNMGAAIMNRLQKAAGYAIIEV